jgi:hypothetical protein
VISTPENTYYHVLLDEAVDKINLFEAEHGPSFALVQVNRQINEQIY